MSDNKRLGFFKLYFTNFKSMFIGNLLFSVPLIISSAFIYGISKLINQSENVWFLGLIIVFVYPFFSGVTQITKDVVNNNKKRVEPVKSYKKGLKNNFKFFLLYGILIYIAFIISYYSIILYFNLAVTNAIFYVPLFIAVLIALFLLFMSFSLPILTVTLELKLKYYFKNSALMAIGELPMNFYVAVTSFVLVSACITISLMTGHFIIGICVIIISLLLILPTGISYCAVYRLYPKIEDVFEIESKEKKKNFSTTPVAIPTDDDGNPINTISNADDDGYVFVNGMMIKKSQINSAEYINESD